ncbi:MAG: hypothetical protein EON58_16660 [Alphaproteobacteria bacterium]|nr:MAG: hypothetical protein EON58_16660 [Alphaproteobacteria bacterium]
MDELPPDDPLLALLDTYGVVGSDIENRVMAQLEREDEQIALQAEVSALRADVAAMRAEMAELKRILLASRQAPLAHPPADSRGTILLPYARTDKALPILG